ncbi:MAG: tRNA lysidine(34) synthetase TilS [Spirochaetota bacterium]
MAAQHPAEGGNPEASAGGFFKLHGLALDTPALVGFSGGPDSTALLEVLSALGAGPLRLVHVDHGLRPESERRMERRLVRKAAARRGLALSMVVITPGLVEARAQRTGSGIEAAARTLRHRAFARLMQKYDLHRLYLGHSADDSLEQMLMSLLGGGGGGGLKGMAPLAGPIVRPLFGVQKQEILAYLDARGLQYSLDSTNGDSRFLRNRVRKELIPRLDASFPGWKKAAEGISEGLRRDDAALAAVTEEAQTRLSRPAVAAQSGGDGESWDGPGFNALPLAIRLRLLAAACSRLDQALPEAHRFSGGRVSRGLVLAACRAFESGALYEGHGFRFSNEAALLRVARILDLTATAGYFIVLEERDVGIEHRFASGIRVRSAWEHGEGPGTPFGLDSACLEFPVVLRSRRAGDRIEGSSGWKMVDRLLSGWHIPREERPLVPIIEDRRGIAAVLGSCFAAGKTGARYDLRIAGRGSRLVVFVKGR